MTEEEIYQAALALPPAERAAFLDQACSGNAVLRAAVEALLAAREVTVVFSNPTLPNPTVPAANQPQGDDEATLDVGPPGDSSATAVHGSPTDPMWNSRSPRDATDVDPRDANAGVVIAGRYVLQEKLGEGGMGEVWVAQQSEPVKRKVALKLIKAGMDSRAVLQRFEQERQALAIMDHPNIARVLDGGLTLTGHPFFVMELVDGQSLTKFCDDARLTPRERLELFVQICQAVQHAHQKGIVHRDLKPANILVARIDGRPVPKVIDFGVAKATSGKLTDVTLSTGFGAVVGTLEYMAPEQAGLSGQDVDTRADIYSLGVILYELLTGMRPFDAKRLRRAALTEMLRVIQEEEPSKPSTRLSSEASLPSLAAVRRIEPRALMTLLSGELDWVVMKCLEKQRDRRYDTANSLARDIQRYLADEPVDARPPSAAYRVRKFVQRHKGPVGAAGLVLFALLAGIVGTTWGLFEAWRQEEIAKQAADAKEQARAGEAKQRAVAESALFDSQEKTARMVYEKGQAFCREGQADLGLLEMARGLALIPSSASDLDRAIRTSMNLWAAQLHTISPVACTDAWRDAWKDAAQMVHFAVSPDGVSLAVVLLDGSIQIREFRSGKILRSLPPESEAPIAWNRRVVFSPDGRFVAAAGGEGRQARIWTVAQGLPVGQPLAHDEPVQSIAFDATGQLAATASGKQIRLWIVARGEPQGEPLAIEEPVIGVEISALGHLLAWSARQVLVYDVASHRLSRSLDGVDFDVKHACFSPDSQYVLAAGLSRLGNPTNDMRAARRAQFWNRETGEPVGDRMEYADQHLNAGWDCLACFRSDGEVAVTGGFPIRMWQAPSGLPLGTTTTKVGADCPAFSKDGKVLVARGRSLALGAKSLFDVAPALLPSRRIKLPGGIRSAIFPASDGLSFASLIEDAPGIALRLHEVQSGDAIGASLEYGLPSAPGAVWPVVPAFDRAGRVVAAPRGDKAVQIWNRESGAAQGAALALSNFPQALAFSPDDRLLAAADLDGQVQIWDTATYQAVGPPMANEQVVNQLLFSPDGSKLLAAGGRLNQIRGEARIWDVATKQPAGPRLDLVGPVHSAAFSPDGKTFATGSYELNLWDAATSSRLWTAPVSAVTRRLAFSPDGRSLLAEHWELNAAGLYDTRSGKPLSPQFRHTQMVTQAMFSPDGRLVLTCSEDRTAQLWDSATGLPVGPLWPNATFGWFGDQGNSLYLRDADMLSRWEIPPPLVGTAEQVRLSVEAATGFDLDEYGGPHELESQLQVASPGSGRKTEPSPDPYERVRKRLEELGGPTGNFRR